jgi:hypothetical protein
MERVGGFVCWGGGGPHIIIGLRPYAHDGGDDDGASTKSAGTTRLTLGGMIGVAPKALVRWLLARLCLCVCVFLSWGLVCVVVVVRGGTLSRPLLGVVGSK